MSGSISGGRTRHGGEGQSWGPIRLTRTRHRPWAPHDSALRQNREDSIVDYMVSRTSELTDLWTSTPAPLHPPLPDDAKSYIQWVVGLLRDRARVYSVTLACLDTLGTLLRVGKDAQLKLMFKEDDVFLSVISRDYLYCSDPPIRHAAAGVLSGLIGIEFGESVTPLFLFPLVSRPFWP